MQPVFCFVAFSRRKPASVLLENAPDDRGTLERPHTGDAACGFWRLRGNRRAGYAAGGEPARSGEVAHGGPRARSLARKTPFGAVGAFEAESPPGAAWCADAISPKT